MFTKVCFCPCLLTLHGDLLNECLLVRVCVKGVHSNRMSFTCANAQKSLVCEWDEAGGTQRDRDRERDCLSVTPRVWGWTGRPQINVCCKGLKEQPTKARWLTNIGPTRGAGCKSMQIRCKVGVDAEEENVFLAQNEHTHNSAAPLFFFMLRHFVTIKDRPRRPVQVQVLPKERS